MSFNNLDQNNKQIIQPTFIKIELKQHQKTAINAMVQLEKQGYVDFKFRYYENTEKDLRVDTRIGILGDKVGSGKTLDILTLLLMNNDIKQQPKYCSSNQFTMITEKDTDKYVNKNIILVNESIQHQWKDCIDIYIDVDNLNYINLQKENDIDLDNNDVNLILCNEKTVLNVIEKYNNIRVNRFIIDEADTINFKHISKINTNFTWLITGTKNGISYCKKRYIKDIFGSNINWLPDIITVKNNDEYIETSMNLPTPNRIMIDCDIPQFIKLLENHIPSNVMNMINAGNISNAIKTLNCHTDTQDNIFKIISKNYKLSIKNILIDIEAEKKKKYINNKSKIEHKNKIAKMETIKDKIEKKLLSLQKSIYDINDEMCPICMNDFEKPTLVDCCAHKYCFTCLTIILQSSHNKCPICRKIITKNRMHVLDIESSDNSDSNCEIEEKVIKKDKLNELLNIIDNERRFIVFSNFDETFVKMEDEFYKNNIKYSILNKNNSKDTINRFKNNDINVLLINTEYFGTGLNLQFATDIILYHRFVPEFEEQIIGRAQRMGRTTKLNVYYLMYENEKVLHRYTENIFF